MSERKAIEERLRKKQAEVASLEEKLKSAKVYVQALHDILKLVEKSGGEPSDADTKLRAGSGVTQARVIILERGEPVHVDDLLSAMGREPTRESRASLVGSIAAYVRRDEIFTRPAPNTFGLIELGHQTIDDNDEAEPPAGFGRQPVAASPFDDDDIPF